MHQNNKTNVKRTDDNQYWGFVRVERPSYLGRTLSEPDVRNYRIRLPNKQAPPRHFQ